MPLGERPQLAATHKPSLAHSAERSLTEMSIQIEPASGADADSVTHRVAAALQYAFGLRVSVSAVPAGSLPRFEAKAKRWTYRSM